MVATIQLQKPKRLTGAFFTQNIFTSEPQTRDERFAYIDCIMNCDAYVVRCIKTKYADRLRQIAELEENWDGYGAVALSKVVMKNTRRFLNAIRDKGFDVFLDEDDIVPTTYGTIDIDFVTTKGVVSVEIGASEIGFFTEFNAMDDVSSDGIETDFHEIPVDVINTISKLI